ncbi:MAG: hypothetical protein JJ975_12945 [Bacteroidia bacterium]|nr:hypothetical protein [Bacteroidia bacterium]
MINRHIAVFLILLTGLYANGQTSKSGIQDSTAQELQFLKSVTDSAFRVSIGVFPKKPDDALYTFKVGGTYRFFGTYTHHRSPLLLSEGGSGDTALPRSLFIGDDAQLPNLTLNFSGRPSAKTSWGFDLYAFQFLDGLFGSTYGQGQVSNSAKPTVYSPLSGTRLAGNLGLLLGINLYGNFETDLGVIGIKTGGIHWVSISDMTLAAFTGYNRFILFERNPWDPIGGKTVDRYDNFFSSGNINQDTRWGEKAFTGTIVEASQLPGKLSLKALYGKTELNGGFLTIPNLSYGGQLKRDLPFGFAAINTFNNQTFSDSLNTESIGFNIATGQIQANIAKGILFKSEIGAGRYFSPIHDLPWGEAINVKLNFNDKRVRFPFEIHYFRVNPNVINNNAIFWNSAIREASNNNLQAGVVGSSATLAPFASSLTGIGQFTNNRQGVNINAEFPFKKFKLSVANGISSEIKGLSNRISYGHPVNQLTRSRFWRWNFPTEVGAYNRYNVIFRDVYEIVELRDTGVAKKFNVIEVQGKYRGKLGLKDFYAFLLNRYSSVQDFNSAITVFSEKAYLRHYSNELETYYLLNPKTVIATYWGYERIIANYRTETDDISRRPRNQEGWGIGLGIDYNLAKNTALFIRHRWFRFEDKSFIRDAFNGTETVVELKLSF